MNDRRNLYHIGQVDTQLLEVFETDIISPNRNQSFRFDDVGVHPGLPRIVVDVSGGQGLEDFALLFLFLEDDERAKVFEELGDEETDEVIASMAAFAYLGIDQERPRFEQSLKRGILQAANRDKLFRSAGRTTDADVSISVEYNPDPEKLARQFEQGKKLTDAEIGLLVRSGKIDGGDLEELQDDERGFPGVLPGGRQQ